MAKGPAIRQVVGRIYPVYDEINLTFVHHSWRQFKDFTLHGCGKKRPMSFTQKAHRQATAIHSGRRGMRAGMHEGWGVGYSPPFGASEKYVRLRQELDCVGWTDSLFRSIPLPSCE